MEAEVKYRALAQPHHMERQWASLPLSQSQPTLQDGHSPRRRSDSGLPVPDELSPPKVGRQFALSIPIRQQNVFWVTAHPGGAGMEQKGSQNSTSSALSLTQTDRRGSEWTLTSSNRAMSQESWLPDLTHATCCPVVQ
ncbi:hypothetical protein P7K49_023467, partial [Saguinus oedipus]